MSHTIHRLLLRPSLLLATLGVLALEACYKDMGNYQYTAPNQAEIGLTTSDSLSIRQNDTLTINVAISQTTGNDSLSYAWYLAQATASNPNPSQNLLGTAQNLHAQITVPLGFYNVVNKVTNKNTGVATFKYFYLQVIPAIQAGEGWLVLQDQSATQNGADISIILSRDGTTHGAVYNNLYASANGHKLPMGTNYMNVLNYNSVEAIQKLVFGYPGGGVQVKATDYTDSSYSNNWFFVPPGSVNVQANSVVNGGQWELLVNNNQVSYQSVNTTTLKTPPILFGAPVLGSWTISPYVMQCTYDGYYTMYDTVHQCFFCVNVSSNNAMVPSQADVPNKHFSAYSGAAAALSPTRRGYDMNNVGKSLVYAECPQQITTGSGTSYWDCFFRSNTQDSMWVIQFPAYLAFTNNDTSHRFWLDPAKCPGIVQATQFACPTFLGLPGVFYYVNGSSIYTCTIAAAQGMSTASAGYAFPAGTIIKAMRTFRSEYSGPGSNPKTPFPATEGKVLVVATDETANGNGNNVYFFNLDPTGNIVAPYSDMYTGFDKIVDIRFKKLIGL
jgi:hypothetical protein